MYEHSNCCNKPVRIEPEEELNDPNGKTFWYVCSQCENPCGINDK